MRQLEPPHDERRARTRTIEPVLQHTGERGIGREQVGQFVEDQGPRPTCRGRFAAQTIEEGAPVRILDGGEPREPLRDGRGQIPPLDRRRREVGHRVEAVVAR